TLTLPRWIERVYAAPLQPTRADAGINTMMMRGNAPNGRVEEAMPIPAQTIKKTSASMRPILRASFSGGEIMRANARIRGQATAHLYTVLLVSLEISNCECACWVRDSQLRFHP